MWLADQMFLLKNTRAGVPNEVTSEYMYLYVSADFIPKGRADSDFKHNISETAKHKSTSPSAPWSY